MHADLEVSADAFLTGPTVYLRRPDLERDVEHGEWHRWFNDLATTRYLVHGARPISRAEQAEFLRTALDSPNRLVLAIVDTASDALCGTVSLSDIDHVHRRAEIAIVIGRTATSSRSAALEAMALLSKHAFDRLNLEKLYAGQHEDLWKWINTLSLIGYELEGFREAMFIRDGRSTGAALTGLEAARFRRLEQTRGGNVLTDDVAALLKTRSPENRVEMLREAIRAAQQHAL
jgi:RimJ/RimL family protein N-acetyltransferase